MLAAVSFTLNSHLSLSTGALPAIEHGAHHFFEDNWCVQMSMRNVGLFARQEPYFWYEGRWIHDAVICDV